MKIKILDLNNTIVDTIDCTFPISKGIEDIKKKYPPSKYHAILETY